MYNATIHMKWIVLLVILWIGIVSGAKAGSHSGSNSGSASTPASKLAQITALAATSKGHVIPLDDATYAHFAVSRPRPYTLFIFLTAASKKYKCTICEVLDREFKLLAESYAANVKKNKGSENIFFIKLDYEQSSKIFQQYQIMSVPLIFHINPHHGERDGENEYDIAQRDRLSIPQNDFDAEMIGNFVRERCGTSIPIQRSMMWAYFVMLVVFGLVALAVKPVIDSLPFWLSVIRMKGIWITLSVGVYVCAISGLIFDIIRSPPMYHASNKGEIMFFYPQSDNQFVAEGFIIGFLNLLCSGALVFLLIAAPKFKSESNRSAAVLGGMILFCFAFSQIRGFYRMKNRWYGSVY